MLHTDGVPAACATQPASKLRKFTMLPGSAPAETIQRQLLVAHAVLLPHGCPSQLVAHAMLMHPGCPSQPPAIAPSLCLRLPALTHNLRPSLNPLPAVSPADISLIKELGEGSYGEVRAA